MKGTYCLIIKVKENVKIKIGALGKIDFNPGFYVYVGSAMNSLEARVKRHLSNNKKLHWHIDYLLNNKDANIVEVIYTVSSRKIECKLSNYIKSDGEIDNFGSSDCLCNSHLYYFKYYENCLNTTINAYKSLNMKYYNLEDFKNICE